MRPHRTLRMTLVLALASAAPGLMAQPVDPGTAPETVAAEDAAATASDLPTVADAGEVDRRCLKYTGSRTTADATPQTKSRRSVHERRQCAMATGTVYTKEDLDRTGEVDVARALRRLDTRL